jgi:hypothetical protein
MPNDNREVFTGAQPESCRLARAVLSKERGLAATPLRGRFVCLACLPQSRAITTAIASDDNSINTRLGLVRPLLKTSETEIKVWASPSRFEPVGDQQNPRVFLAKSGSKWRIRRKLDTSQHWRRRILGIRFRSPAWVFGRAPHQIDVFRPIHGARGSDFALTLKGASFRARWLRRTGCAPSRIRRVRSLSACFHC